MKRLMKVAAGLLAALRVLPLGAAAVEELPVEAVEMKIGTWGAHEWQEDIQLATLTFGTVELTNAAKEKYPELATSVSNYSEAGANGAYEGYAQLVGTARADVENGPFYGPYILNESIAVRRADSTVVSLLCSGYSYSGGAHGTPYYSCANFDSHTGRRLSLSDIVTDAKLLEQRAQAQLDQWYSGTSFFAENPMEGYFADLDDILHNWTLDPEGLTLYFGAYDLAPYAEGSQIVTIPFAGNEDLFQPGWNRIPESYTVGMQLSVPYYTDLDSDGQQDCVILQSWADEWGSYNGLDIVINDRCIEEDNFAFSLLPVLIHTGRGQNVLCVENLQENDYHELHSFMLGIDAVQDTGCLNGGFVCEKDPAGSVQYMKVLPTGSKAFALVSRIWLLGTVSGEKSYTIDEDGRLDTADSQFTITPALELMLKRPLEGRVVNPQTMETGDAIVSVPAGQKLYWIRTNGASTADLLLGDGSSMRVEVNRQEWPYTINGVDVEEIFDGMIFAG